jgi:hypothetical protein
MGIYFPVSGKHLWLAVGRRRVMKRVGRGATLKIKAPFVTPGLFCVRIDPITNIGMAAPT